MSAPDARAFLASLGAGVNIASWNIRYGNVHANDYAWLASRVGHVRLGGWIAEPLLDWTTCPVTTRGLAALGGSDESAIERIIQGDGAEPWEAEGNGPPMALLRQAAADAVAAGLKVVLNPFHQRFMGEVSADTVRWVWGAVLQEFPLADFPASAVAFEMVNEPRSAPPASRLRGSLEEITRAWVAQVRAAQPERVLIAPGEMGKVGGGPYRSSRQGLLDAAGWLNTLDVIATFHYYDPRDFTNQDEDDGIKWLGRPWEVAEIASDFAEVSAALDVPVYVGEFGLNSHIDDDHAIEWLESVRESAVAAGFETAVWHLLDGGEGLTTAETAALRRKEWDSNPLAAAAVGSSAQGSQGRRLEQRALGKFDDGCDLDGGRRPSWAVPLLAKICLLYTSPSPRD